MPKIVFYKQARDDSGVRTGIEIEELTYFELFEKGDEESDPALKWWIDVRLEGPALPDTPERARQWLLENTKFIASGFNALAEKLRVGMDRQVYPLSWPIPNAPPGIEASIVCSVARRITGREIADVLMTIAQHLEEDIKRIPAAHSIAV